MSGLERVHGGCDARELLRLGLDARAVLDLSVNVNPCGPHPAVLAALQRADVSRYPQPWAAEARAAIARSCAVDEARVVIGHGSTELIWSAVSLLRGAAGPLVIAAPTFSEPALAARACGVAVVELRSRAQDEFALDLGRLSDALEQQRAAAAYLCQPNNPDGGCVPAPRLRELCAAHPSRLFLLDQAFLSLSTRHRDLSLQFPDNVLVVRSMTKEHALPGLRVGYALGAASLIERLNRQRPSWMVSSLAEAAIVAACAQPQHVEQARSRMLADRAALSACCRELGLRVVPSTTSFCLIQVGDAERVRSRLLAGHGIAVRSCASFGLPEFIRVAGCSPQDLARVCAALARERAR